ncbi:MAG: hypothetical protein MUF61_03160, partial [archaeon]|nr:hypothetical protein [archaeon]
IAVNVTANDSALATVNISLYNSTGLVNNTGAISSPLFVNFTGLRNGIYYFNATACDYSGNCNYTETRMINITIDRAVLFYDDFESAVLSSNWTLNATGAIAKNWTSSTLDPYEGARHAESNPLSTSEPASTMEASVSTYGYKFIEFSYYRKLIEGIVNGTVRMHLSLHEFLASCERMG